MLRPDTVVMAWRGMQIARQAALAGHEVVAAPVFPTYFDYYQERGETEPVAIGGPVRLADVAAFAPVPADWPQQARERMIGTPVPGMDRVHQGWPGAGVHDLPAGLRAGRRRLVRRAGVAGQAGGRWRRAAALRSGSRRTCAGWTLPAWSTGRSPGRGRGSRAAQGRGGTGLVTCVQEVAVHLGQMAGGMTARAAAPRGPTGRGVDRAVSACLI